MHRLFAALRPAAEVRSALLAGLPLTQGWRWQDDDQLHLTLSFLGEVSGPVAESVAEAVSRFDFAPLLLSLSGAGAFDGRRRGEVGSLWVGVQPRAPLAALAGRLARTLEAAGAAPERRRFVPHVTLARVVGGGRPAAAARGFLEGWRPPPLRWTADRIWLLESHLAREGARYVPVVLARARGCAAS